MGRIYSSKRFQSDGVKKAQLVILVKFTHCSSFSKHFSKYLFNLKASQLHTHSTHHLKSKDFKSEELIISPEVA